MATAMDDNNLRETEIASKTSSVSKKIEIDEVPDYNEAFPQLMSAAGHVDINRSNTFFSTSFPSASSNGNNSTSAIGNTTTSLFSTTKADEDRRRKMAIHASSVTTKIVSLFFCYCINDKLITLSIRWHL
ncbi:unnamed protein product [Rotaria magnacalcarata]|uniref:Uncharacterized protein n=1 Tax=Rotaria magnacalcarata TaxID=392030 RepID=A0A8S2QMS5_9BILA|nr:unnamed protein product [Rotaria magnacalcarata]